MGKRVSRPGHSPVVCELRFDQSIDSLMAPFGLSGTRKPLSRVKGSFNKKTGARRTIKSCTSNHHQMLLLHKSLKKAKQFELRKLIRRLKAAAAASPAGTESAATETEAAVSNKLQAQYDITKTLETDVLLQQAASSCGLPPAAATLSQPLSKEQSKAKDQLLQLACSRLLSATCVKQQMQAIKDQQAAHDVDLMDTQPVVSGLTQDAATSHEELQTQGEAATDQASIWPAAVNDSSERTSAGTGTHDNEAAHAAQDAEEDRQIADAAISRLLDIRAAAAEPRDSSATESSELQMPELSDVSMPTSSSEQSREEAPQQQVKCSEAREQQLPQTKRKRSMPPKILDPMPQQHKKQKTVEGNQKPKDKVKKKKNRLGQRARQQLGRVKQSQQMAQGASSRPPGWKKPARQAVHDVRSMQSRPPAARTAESNAASAVPVHPSWLAKRKQQQALVIAAPRGSKTVFSDDGQVVPSVATVTAPKVSGRQPSAAVKPTAGKVHSAEAKNLHPSWLAKKAAAAKQAEFASTKTASKITFAD